MPFGIGMFLYATLDIPWVKETQGHSIGLLLASKVVQPFSSIARRSVARACSADPVYNCHSATSTA